LGASITGSLQPEGGRPTPVELVAALAEYTAARRHLLALLRLEDSNRDPFAEFAEHLVAALTAGTLAANRVQSEWDITEPDGSLNQVRYLANPAGRWPNEHLVRNIAGVTWYTLVLYEGGEVTGVLSFPQVLAPVCTALGKRHPGQDQTLQFTLRNWWTIRDDPDHFRDLGVRVWLPPFGP